MDSRARVEAALAGTAPDRPPVGAWGYRYEEEWSPEALAAVTVARARRLGWDFIKFQPRATCFAEAFGAAYRPAADYLHAPAIDEPPMKQPNDWRDVQLVDRRVLDEQVQALRLVVAELGNRIPVLQTVFSPLSVASYLAGRENRKLVRWMQAEPDIVLPAFSRIADVLVDFCLESVDAGAAGVFFAISGFATPDSMAPAVYEDMVLPMDLRILEALPPAAWCNVLHLCGSHLTMDVAEQLPVQVVSYSIHNQGNPPLGEVIRSTGRAVMGGVEQRQTLVDGPVEAIAQQVRDAIAATGGRGLLLAPGCSVPPHAPDAHLRTLCEAAERYAV
jgi:uroporphyrinogen decarboxylase